jgi:alpha-N-arabinofuranosidase
VFAVNRAPEPLSLIAPVRGLEALSVIEHLTLTAPDLDATNTAEHPDRVTPRALDTARLDATTLQAELPPRSWNVLRLSHRAATR